MELGTGKVAVVAGATNGIGLALADFLDVVVERFHGIGEQINSSRPEEFPGMPPRAQMMAEVMAAMLPPE